MAKPKRQNSEKYKGVYFREVPRRDGRGMERDYYIVYKRPGERKNNEDHLGRASDGWNESKASRERAARIEGKLSNTEKRQRDRLERLTKGEALTFGRLWEIYRDANSDKASMRNDAYNFRNHIEKRLGKKLIEDIHTADIAAIRRAMEAKGLAPQTIRLTLGQIRSLIRYGVKLGLCSMPDKLLFEMPKVDNQKTENMTAEQLAAYWRALDGEEDQDAAALLRLALLTGIRRGALFALRWDDIDFERQTITLRGVAAKNGKTAILPLNEAALAVLRAITRTSDFIFPGRDGGQRKDYRRIARRVRAKAGLPANFRPLHGLRHTFASRLASSGNVNLYTLQKLLTHGSAAMTQRYAHLADEALRRAANVANGMAGGNDKE